MSVSLPYLSRPTSTEDLVRRLAGSNCDIPKERMALEAIVKNMIRIFRDHTELQYIQEAGLLSLIVNDGDYQDLVLAFANAIIKGTTDGLELDTKLLAHFACVLRRAPSVLSAETARLGSVLDSLQKRLDKAVNHAELETQYQLICTLSTVLDAMVDIKISGLSRQVIHEPLLKQLDQLRNHQEPRLSQVSSYAYRGLLGVPDDEGPYQALWRYSCSVVQVTAKVGGAISTMDPMKLIDCTPDLMNLLSLVKTLVDTTQELYHASQDLKSVIEGMKSLSKQKGWYVALRYTQMLIEAKAFQLLETFILQKPCHEEEPFLCGLYAQLEQAWVMGDSPVKDRVVELIQRTISQIGPKHQRAHEWVRLIADTVGQPSWKDVFPRHLHKMRIWKNQNYESKLKRFPRETVKTGDLSTHLLKRAWSECDKAHTFYADTELRKYYAQGSLLEIKRLSGELLDMDRCYINLAVIEHSRDVIKRQLENKEIKPQPSAFTLFTRLKVEASDTEKEVELLNLFKSRERPDGTMFRPKRILIRGRAGVGKTTLCKKIVHDFLYKHTWGELFDRIFWIPLRSLKGKSSLDELLPQEYFSTQREPKWLVQALWKSLGDETNERTLFLLDGLDEISGERSISGTDLTEKFRGLLNRQNVIITSRPYAVNLPGLTPFDLELETIGFHRNQVQAYLEKVVDKGQAEDIWLFIQGHWLIQGLAQIPIQLDALCYSWDSDLRSSGVPETMTALYQAIELKLWKKDILQLEKRDEDRVLLSESRVQKLQIRSQIEHWVEKEIELVEFFAFTGLYNDIVEFDMGFRSKIYEQPSLRSMSDDILDKISFLRTSDSSSKLHNSSYHFLHLTFQEYFAAQYFVRCWVSGRPLYSLKLRSMKEKTTSILPESFLQQEKYNGRYDVFWRFVAGLLQKEQLRRFFEMLEDKPQDLLGPAHQRLLMHCFSEVPPNSGLENLQTGMEAQLKQWVLFEYRLRGKMTLCCEMEFPDNVLITMMNEGEPKDVKSAILQALQHRSNSSACLVNLVASLLGHDVSSDLKMLAIDALSKQTALSDDILQAIVRLLEHSDGYIR